MSSPIISVCSIFFFLPFAPFLENVFILYIRVLFSINTWWPVSFLNNLWISWSHCVSLNLSPKMHLSIFRAKMWLLSPYDPALGFDLTLIKHQSLIYSSHNYIFPVQNPILSHVLHCHVPTVSFNQPLFFLASISLKSRAQSFSRILLNLGLSNDFSCLSLHIVWQEYKNKMAWCPFQWLLWGALLCPFVSTSVLTLVKETQVK